MQSKLKERFARLGPVKGVDRVQSGSPVDLVLRPDRAMLSYLRVIALFLSTAAQAQQADASAVVKANAQRNSDSCVEAGRRCPRTSLSNVQPVAKGTTSIGFLGASAATKAVAIRAISFA